MRPVVNAQIRKTRAVVGRLKATYMPKLGCTIRSELWLELLSHASEGTANMVAKKVAGRKAMVMMAITFIEELSCLLVTASVREIRFMSFFQFVSTCL